MVAIVESRYKTEKEKFKLFLPLFICLKLSTLFEHTIFTFYLFSLILKCSPTFILLMKKTYISTVIHICSVLCNMTINIFNKFLNCSELI